MASPPLVVAFALTGKVNVDLTKEPIGKGSDGQDVFLKDIWPSSSEIAALMPLAQNADTFKRLYHDLTKIMIYGIILSQLLVMFILGQILVISLNHHSLLILQ